MNDQVSKVPARGNFLWWCAGAVPNVLRLYPTEKAKYEGIGGAVLTTGILAFFSGFYAIYSTIAGGPYGVFVSVALGILWGLAIFNLDRYIVSSLRKSTDPGIRWHQRLRYTWLPALPRLGLAILIGVTLSKPLELRLFQNAVASQAAINRDLDITAKRGTLTQSSSLATLEVESKSIESQLAEAEPRARLLEDEFRKEADGTGGSLRYGYSEVARLKESAAVLARQRVAELQKRQTEIQIERDKVNAQINQQVEAFRQGMADDFLTKMRALSELSSNSTAVWWISSFVVFLLIGIEITPVVVKLLSPIGPYDLKLDAMNSVENNEAILKRDTTNRILAHHYALVERDATTEDANATFEQFNNHVRTDILSHRTG